MGERSNIKHNERAVLGTFGALLATTLVSGGVIASMPASADDSTKSSSVSVTVSSACTLTSNNASGISKTIDPGIRDDELGTTTMTAMCNNPQGYDVYAVGYSNNEWKNNQMIGILDDNKFNTRERGDGSYTDTSHWYMKLDKPTGSNISIENNYNNYSRIPGTSDKQAAGDETDEGYVKVASLDATTQGISSADFQVTYGAYVTSAQSADTYTGQVKYTIVSPQGTDAPEAKDPTPCILNNAEYCMQNIADWSSKLAVGDTVTAMDDRDGAEYLVGKLKDNKIWMLDNLALDPTTVSLDDLKGKTNADNTSLEHLKNGGGATSDQYATAAVANWTSGYSYSAPLIAASGDGWDKDTTATHYGVGSGKIGVYYNYCAASAGSYCYGNGTSQGTSSGDATYDICPAGWKMPTGNGGEWGDLLAAYEDNMDANDAKSIQYNLSLPLSGYFDNGSAGDRGVYGYWWSSTRDSNRSMYYFYAYDSYANATYVGYRYYGHSMRCVAQ